MGKKDKKSNGNGKPERLSKDDYDEALEPLQLQINDVARWLQHTGKRLLVLIEGRDTAGKGGVISAIADTLNPRQCRVVALGKPSEAERTQWYFQRYVPHLPAAGEMVLFDRSWYNRAGVERVMGFCTDDEYEEFFRSVPEFERMLARSGIQLIKYWFSITDEEQHFLLGNGRSWRCSPRRAAASGARFRETRRVQTSPEAPGAACNRDAARAPATRPSGAGSRHT